MSDTELMMGFAPSDAKTGKPIELAMQRLWLVGRIMGVGARLLVKHTFRSGEKKPLEVVYSFVLPRDAALRRFHVTGRDFSVSSELKPTAQAVEEYEKAIAEGHLASMARQYVDGMVNLTVGNIRPGEEVAVNLEIIAGVEVRDDGIRFRFPFTLAPAYHAKARAAEVEPGVGEIELPAEEFGDLILPQFVSDASALHEVGFDLAVSMGHPIVEAGSPSHAVRIVGQGIGRTRVSLATAKDLPDRDLVLDVRTGEKVAGALAGTGRDGRGHFAATVPSGAFKGGAAEDAEEEPRRVVFVLDRSGSMGGMPIEQARKAVAACLGALGEKDRFGIVAFDDRIETFGDGLAPASMEEREAAGRFLKGIDARGGTELAKAIDAAAAVLKGSEGGGGGDIMVVTDGQVMGTEAILAVARANGLRLHCLGIGSASQDRFLTLLARETGGVSRFVTPRERVDLGAVDLFASVGRPLGSALSAKVEGFGEARIAPEVPGCVFGGTPVVVYGDTDGEGDGSLVLQWESGGAKRRLTVPIKIGAGGEGETLRLLQGARLITDTESRSQGGVIGPGGRRETERIKNHLIALSRTYGLVSMEMGLVAVVKWAGDQPGDLPVVKVVPVGLAQNVMMESYFQNSALCYSIVPSAPAPTARLMRPSFGRLFHRRVTPDDAAILRADRDLGDQDDLASPGSAAALMSLASKLGPDGGMPGASEEERVLATILALLQFLQDGHSTRHGAFRAHVRRMTEFLKASGAGDIGSPVRIHAEAVKAVIERAEQGRPLADAAQPFDLSIKGDGSGLWARLEKVLGVDK